ncbi:putative 2-ketoarginine decarboxylase AruI [Methylobacterium crusticola]|uniref:2-ketoarginine decarboxylase AruI n=1 Tax=Methylobacterium crusticola TaxID=1697972 RepID=A0ABQ4R679_9HYPH|nr:thiamine pyrophosphate-dependent enzyme [Methylobacterium crusticola]GJD53213.1 putative 2-ketoarginine decarboxylase AruI [Methylobacterium crusticola]
MGSEHTDATTGGAALVEALIVNGVDTVFGLPGAQMYPFFDALQRRGDRIRTCGARHEQACGYMAFGYARSTGRPGVYAVVPGPGVLNTAAALSTAYGCNAPVLCITGQVPSGFLGQRRGHLHELPDQLATLRSLTKWSARVERVEDAPAVIDEAFRRMLGGRPGPVAVEMAWDVMAARAPVRALPPAVPEARPRPDADAVARAARILVAARRPMIMTGSGAQHASVAVLALAEALAAPVAALRGGRGIVAEDHPLGASSYAAYRLWPGTDALLGIGSRLEMPYMRWRGMMTYVREPGPSPALIRIDIDPEEHGRLVPEVGLVADAEDGARALLDAVRRLRGGRGAPDRSARLAEVAAAKREARAAIGVVQPQLSYLDAIRAALPRDGFFVGELSQVGFASYFGFPVYAPRTYVSEGYQGTLGFGFPTALGVKVAHPGRAVVSVTGDGGFLFAVQELATAAQEGIGLVTVLFDNHSYGNVLRDQNTGYGGRVIGAVLDNPDFVALAASFGVDAVRVDSPEDLGPALAAALAAGRPALIVVAVERGTEASPWPFIHPAPVG